MSSCFLAFLCLTQEYHCCSFVQSTREESHDREDLMDSPRTSRAIRPEYKNSISYWAECTAFSKQLPADDGDTRML
jgi:hypothetical protein